MNKPTMQGRRLLALLLALLMLVTMVPAAALAEAIEAVVPAATVEQQQDVTQAPEAGLPELSTDKAAAKATSLKAVKINSKSFKQNGTAKLTLTTKNAVAAFVTVDNKTELPEDLTDAVAIKKNKATIKLPVVGLEKGSHQLYVWLQDKDGNWAQRGKKVTVKVTQKPAVVEEPVTEVPSEAEAKEEGALEIAPVIMPELASESGAVAQDELMALAKDDASTDYQRAGIDGINFNRSDSSYGIVNGQKTLFLDLASGTAGTVKGKVFFDLTLKAVTPPLDCTENGSGATVCAWIDNPDGNYLAVERNTANPNPNTNWSADLSYDTTTHTGTQQQELHDSFVGVSDSNYLEITATTVGIQEYTLYAYFNGVRQNVMDTIAVIVYDSTYGSFVGLDVDDNIANEYVIDLKGQPSASAQLDFFIQYRGWLLAAPNSIEAKIIFQDDAKKINVITTPNWAEAVHLYLNDLYKSNINVEVDKGDLNQSYKFTLEMTIKTGTVAETHSADFTVRVVDSTKDKIDGLDVSPSGATDSNTIFIKDLSDPAENKTTLSSAIRWIVGESYDPQVDKIGAPTFECTSTVDVADITFVAGTGAAGDTGTITAKLKDFAMAGQTSTYKMTMTVNGVPLTSTFTISVVDPTAGSGIVGVHLFKADSTVLAKLKAINGFFTDANYIGDNILDLKGKDSASGFITFEFFYRGNAALALEDLNAALFNVTDGAQISDSVTLLAVEPYKSGNYANMFHGYGAINLSAIRSEIGKKDDYTLTLTADGESRTMQFTVAAIDSFAPDYLGLAANSLVIDFAGANGPVTKTTTYTISSNGKLYAPPTAFDYLTATKNSGDAALAVTVAAPEQDTDTNGTFFEKEGTDKISIVANRADIGKTATYDLAVSINGVVHTTQFNVQVIDSSMDLIESLDVYADKASPADSNTIYLVNPAAANTSTLSYKINLNGVGAKLPDTASVSAPTVKHIGGAGYEDVADITVLPTIVVAGNVYSTDMLHSITMTARPGMAGKTGLYRLTYVINGVEISDDFEVRVANVMGGDTELVMLNFIGQLLGENTILDLKGQDSITGQIDFEFNVKGNVADINDIKASVNTDKYARNLVSSVQLVGGLTPMASVPGAAIGGGEINLIATKADVGTQLEYLLSLTFNGKTMSIPFVVTVVDSYDANYDALRMTASSLTINFAGQDTVPSGNRQATYSISADNMLVKSNTTFGTLSATYSSGDTPEFPATVAIPAEIPATGTDPLALGYVPAHYETTGLVTFDPSRADIGKTIVYNVLVEINGVVHTAPITVRVIDSAMDKVVGLDVYVGTGDSNTLFVEDTKPQPTGTLSYMVNWFNDQYASTDTINNVRIAFVDGSGTDVAKIEYAPNASNPSVGKLNLTAHPNMAGKSGTYRMSMDVNGVTVSDTFTVYVTNLYGQSGFIGFHILNTPDATSNTTLVDDAVLDLKGADSVAGKLTFEYFYRGVIADLKEVQHAFSRISGSADFVESITLKTIETYSNNGVAIPGLYRGIGEINLTAQRAEIDKKDTYALTLTVNGVSSTITFTVAAIDSTNGNGLLAVNFVDLDEAFLDLDGKPSVTGELEFRYVYSGNFEQFEKAVFDYVSKLPGGHMVKGIEPGKFSYMTVSDVLGGTSANIPAYLNPTDGVWVGFGKIKLAATREDIGVTEHYTLNVNISDKTLGAPFAVTAYDSTNGKGLLTISLIDPENALIDLKGKDSETAKINFRYSYSGNIEQLDQAVAKAIAKLPGSHMVTGVTLGKVSDDVIEGKTVHTGLGTIHITATRADIDTFEEYDLNVTINDKTLTAPFTVTVIDSTNGNGLLTVNFMDLDDAFLDLNGKPSVTGELEFRYVYSGNFEQFESAVFDYVSKLIGGHMVKGIEPGKFEYLDLANASGQGIVLPAGFTADGVWVGFGKIKLAATREDIGLTEYYTLNVNISDKTLGAPFTVTAYDSTNGKGLLTISLIDPENGLIDMAGQDSVTATINFRYSYSGNIEQLDQAVAKAIARLAGGHLVTGVTLGKVTDDVVDGKTIHTGLGTIHIVATRADIGTFEEYDLNVTINDKTLTAPFIVTVIDSTNGNGIVALDMNSAANDSVIDLAGELTKDGAINFRYIYTGNFKDIENFETKLTLIDPATGGPTHSITMGAVANMTPAAPKNAWYGLGTVNLLATQEDVGKRFTYELSMRVKGTDQYITQTFTVTVIDTNNVMITPVKPAPDATNGHYYLFVGETLKVQYSIPYYQNLVGKIWNVTSTDFAAASAASSYDDATNPKTLFGDVSIYGKAVGTGTHTLSIDDKEIGFTVTVYPKLDNNNVRLDPASATLTLRNDGSEKQVFTIKAPDGVKIDDYDIVWTVTGVDKNGNPTISVFGQGKTATVTGLNYGQGIVTATLTAPKTTGVTTPAEIILSAPVTVADRNLAKLIVTDAGEADAVTMANMEVRQTILLEKIVDYHFVHYIDGEWADPNADEAFPGAVTYTYASSNTSVATVGPNGLVTCVGKGAATITVTGTYRSKYGDTYVQSVDFRVYVGSNSITIDPNEYFELFPGDIKDITYTTDINVALDSHPKVSWRIDRADGASYVPVDNAEIMRWVKDSRQLIIGDKAPAGDYVLTLQLIGEGKAVVPLRSKGEGSYILIDKYDNPITGYDYPITDKDAVIAASVVHFRVLAKPQKVLVDDTLGNAKPQNVTAAQLAADYTAAYPKTLTMSFIGKTAKLKATVLPNESYLQSVTWYSVDPKVAMVDPVTGVVTATGAGTTQVYAKTTVAGLKDRDQIDEGYIIIESVGKANIFTLDPSYKEILVNGKVQIVPYFVDIDGIDKARQVKVEYEALDVVTGAGTTASGESYVKLHSWFDRETNKWLLDVTGLKPGEVVIKATIFKGTSEEQAAFSTIVINEAVTEISATRKHLTIAVGQQYMYDLLGTLTFNGKAGNDTSYLNTGVTVEVMDPTVVAIDKEDYSYILGLKIGTTMIKVRSVENKNVYCDILVDVVDIAQFLYTDVESIMVYEGTNVPVSITSKLDTVYGALTWTYQDYAGKAFDGIAPGTGELIAWYDANNKQVVANKAGYVELIATAKLPTDLYDTYYNGLYIGNYMPPEARLKIRVTVLKKAETVKIDFLNDRALESLVTPVKVNINGRDRYKVEFPVGSRFILHASVAPETTYDKELVWTSSDPKVASVDAFGIVTVRKAGTVHIYATAKSGVQDIFVVNAIPTDRAQLGITTECAVPIYRTADTSDRVAYLKQGITFVIAGKEGKYYKIEYGVGDLDYAYVKKDKVEIVSDTDTITGSPAGMITTTYNATIGTATLAYSVDMFDATKTQATQVYMPVGTRILICAKASTDPAGTGNYYKISFGDNNMFENYYVLMSTVAFADFYKTPGVGVKVTYDASTIATIANNVIVDPGTGSQIGTEIEDPTIAIRAAINVSSAEVYSGFEPADRVVVGRLYRGTEVTIVSKKHEGYYQLRLDNGTVCWIRYDYVTALGKAPVTAPTLDVKLYKTTKATYLRKSAASRGTVISRLAKNTKLYATGEEKNGYVRVKTITGTLGWILKTCVTDYRIELDTSSDIQQMATIKSKAKFLKTDKKTGKLMSTLKVGTEVIVLEEARNGFVKVMLINGKEGFVLASKLGEAYDANVDLPSTGSSTEIKYHKINVSRLNVYNLPSYAGSTVIATLKANESVFVEYEIKDGNGNLWYYIELPDGSHGYVYGISTLLFI